MRCSVRSNPSCVFDTNVLVSALLFDRSTPAQAFFVALNVGEILVSADTIAELNDVLGREKFTQYVSEEERTRFLQSLLHEARLVEIREEIRACRDPKDDKFLELAVNGEADCIVSGDEDLLSLDPFRGIPILTPDKFLDALSGIDQRKNDTLQLE
jgi:putative PIN family toxin of toxin-antitoxin system